jgi:hypothetical protein
MNPLTLTRGQRIRNRAIAMKVFFSGRLAAVPRLLAYLFGYATGCAMAAVGLAARITDAPPSGPAAAWFGTELFQAAGLSAGRIGWMLVLEGAFWIAALSALGVRNHWGWWSTAAAAMISMIFFPGGTLAGVVMLLAVGILLIRITFRVRAARQASRA